MTHLTFVGMPKIEERQAEYLNVLGAAFAVDGVQLRIKPRGGANEAVIAGYKARGGSPTETSTPFSQAAQGVLVFGDSSFTDALDQHAPGWRSNDPTLVYPHELHDYIIAALAGLKEKELALEHIESGALGNIAVRGSVCSGSLGSGRVRWPPLRWGGTLAPCHPSTRTWG